MALIIKSSAGPYWDGEKFGDIENAKKYANNGHDLPEFIGSCKIHVCDVNAPWLTVYLSSGGYGQVAEVLAVD